MNLTITDEAMFFYKREMNLNEGDKLHLYVRVGGVGSGGFSAGITHGEPELDAQVLVKEGIEFCVSDEDVWYFDGMTIDYDADYDAVTYDNPSIQNTTNPHQPDEKN